MRGDLVAVVAGLCRILEQKHSLVFALVPALLTPPAWRPRCVRTCRVPTSPAPSRSSTAAAAGELPGRVEPGEIRKVTEALVWYRLFFTGEPLDDAFARTRGRPGAAAADRGVVARATRGSNAGLSARLKADQKKRCYDNGEPGFAGEIGPAAPPPAPLPGNAYATGVSGLSPLSDGSEDR